MGLLDGLATAIRFRLSSRAREGAWAGPDAMVAGVVLAGDPLNEGQKEWATKSG